MYVWYISAFTWDWDYLQGHCCGPTENAIKQLSKKNQGKCKMHQVCIRNLLCGDVEGTLTTRTQWHVSTLKACLAQKNSSHSFPSVKIQIHLDGIGEGGCWPLAAPPCQGGRRLSSSLAQPPLSPWTHLGGVSDRVENGFPVNFWHLYFTYLLAFRTFRMPGTNQSSYLRIG